MSRLVGILLHDALRNAGHPKWHTVRTETDWLRDEIIVRFDSGAKADRKHVDFRIPNGIFDPVAYAQEKWPKWFKDKSIEESKDVS
jgi:hypothetical protein